MISVTSMTSPNALRWTIMSYLNKAPSVYLGIIQSVLDLTSAEMDLDIWTKQGSNTPSLNTVQMLALDIFAHWLVLLTLLDGVWWIGGIGQWELGQIVSFMKAQVLFPRIVAAGEKWWPESMYIVNLELVPTV